MTGAQVIEFPGRREREAELTYEQLALTLGVSPRFLKYRVAEGMPNLGLDYAGKRRFLLSEIQPWLDARNERLGRGSMRGARSSLPAEEAS